jgi:hypothetical protein
MPVALRGDLFCVTSLGDPACEGWFDLAPVPGMISLASGGLADAVNPDATADPRIVKDADEFVLREERVCPVTGLSVLSSPDSRGDLIADTLLNLSRSSGAGDGGLRLGERSLRELEDCDEGEIDLLRGAGLS